jgi:nucleoside-diphosphate-sugar epimerase
MRIAVIGATGRTGRRVVAQLCERNHAVAAFGLTQAKLGALDRRASGHAIDLVSGTGCAALREPFDVLVSCAHARYTGALLQAAPDRATRFVLMGSVRRYLTIEDRDGGEIAEAERLLDASGRPGIMLHASMIFGAPDDGNVTRVLRLLARFPKGWPIPLPLPDGGRRLVQPIFVDDVAASVVAAVERPASDGAPLVLAGPLPMEYRSLVTQCAAAIGRRAVVLPIPMRALAALAAGAERFGIALPLKAAELRRAGEDKSFDIQPMIERLGVRPIDFADGLRRMALPG